MLYALYINALLYFGGMAAFINKENKQQFIYNNVPTAKIIKNVDIPIAKIIDK